MRVVVSNEEIEAANPGAKTQSSRCPGGNQVNGTSMVLETSPNDICVPPSLSRYRRPLLFRQTDLDRALRSAKRAGDGFAVRVEPDGSMIVGPFGPHTMPQGAKSASVRDYHL
jgi:hypothetical protein